MKASACKIEPSKTNQQNVTTILLNHPYNLCYFSNHALVLVTCFLVCGRLWLEQYWVCSVCCCAWRVSYVVSDYMVFIGTVHSLCGPSYMPKL